MKAHTSKHVIATLLGMLSTSVLGAAGCAVEAESDQREKIEKLADAISSPITCNMPTYQQQYYNMMNKFPPLPDSPGVGVPVDATAMCVSRINSLRAGVNLPQNFSAASDNAKCCTARETAIGATDVGHNGQACTDDGYPHNGGQGIGQTFAKSVGTSLGVKAATKNIVKYMWKEVPGHGDAMRVPQSRQVRCGVVLRRFENDTFMAYLIINYYDPPQGEDPAGDVALPPQEDPQDENENPPDDD